MLLWTSPPHFMNSTIFQKRKIGLKMYVLIFSTTSAWNISHSKKNWARYAHGIIMGGSISPEAGRANMVFIETFEGHHKLHIYFCPCLMLKHSLVTIKTLFLHHWNFLLGPEDVQSFFSLNHQTAKPRTEEEKNVMLGNTDYLKSSQ